MEKNFKKIISGVLVAASLASTLTIGSFAAGQELTLGKKTAINAKKTTTVEFTPKESGDYMFYSIGNKNDDPYATLYLSEKGNLKKIDSGDDNATSSNFEIYATLEKGKKYVLKCKDSSRIGDKKYSVSVRKTHVKSVEFNPFEPIKICQNDRAYGKYKTVKEKGKSVTYFQYDLTNTIFKNGNEITVNYNNGKKSVTYDYDYHEIHTFSPGWNGDSCGYIFDSDKEDITLKDSDVRITTTQSSKHWDKPGTYYATLTVFGKNVKVPVIIEKSPVRKIEYFPAEKINHVGEISKDEFFVDRSTYFNYGDRLKVTYNDKRGTVEYTYEFYSEDGIVGSGQSFVDKNGMPIFDVVKTKAKKGSDGNYYSKVSYLGKSTTFKYNCVSASNIKVSFTAAHPLTVAENDEHFGFRQNWGKEAFVYNVSNLLNVPGNKITVTDKTGTTVYTYNEKQCEYVSKDGYMLTSYEVSDNQEKSPWKIGGNNIITLNIYGVTCKIPVKVIKCSHKNTVTKKTVSATCENSGWTEGEYCNTCHTYISGHEEVRGGHKAKPEFKWVGSKAYVTLKCTVCKKTVYKENERIGNETAKVTKKATTKKNGTLVKKAKFIFGSDEHAYHAKKTETIRKIGSIKLSKTSFTYNGKTQKPYVVIKDADGKKLKRETDYTLTYSDAFSAEKGTYKVTINFIGKYGGSKTLSYKIVK